MRRGSMRAGELRRSLMKQIQTLIETSAQFGRSHPDRSPPSDQEIGRQLRILQHLGSWLECRHAHQDYGYHQSALQQSQNSAQETVKTAESGLLHHPSCKSGGQAEQEQDGKKDDEEAKNLS